MLPNSKPEMGEEPESALVEIPVQLTYRAARTSVLSLVSCYTAACKCHSLCQWLPSLCVLGMAIRQVAGRGPWHLLESSAFPLPFVIWAFGQGKTQKSCSFHWLSLLLVMNTNRVSAFNRVDLGLSLGHLLPWAWINGSHCFILLSWRTSSIILWRWSYVFRMPLFPLLVV